MSDYVPLAIKYRPRTFDDIVSQAHNSLVLKNIIEKGNVAPSYIFAGSRGCGKTTTARIFARALNCTNLHDFSPCGECDRCVSILSGRSFDVLELDAASHGNVDDIRDLKQKASYSMNDMEYRVFIFDEAHMMSRAAFDTMLKLIEEPPPNTVFIFATTEPDKIPDTIHSRSLPFTFRRISTRDIVVQLKMIVDKEELLVDDDALALIARNSLGGLRDAITILEQVSSLAEHVTSDSVRRFLGLVGTEVYYRIIEALISNDVKGSFEILGEVSLNFSELGPFSRGLIEYLRDTLLIINEVAPDRTDSELSGLRKIAESIPEDKLLKLLDLASETSDKLRYTSFNPLAHFEVSLLKMNHILNGTPRSQTTSSVEPPIKPPSILDRQPSPLTAEMVIAATGATVETD